MPHVTHLSDPLSGPVITILVGVSLNRMNALQQAGLEVPNAIAVNFLIDTGASSSVIDNTVIAPLELSPTGFRQCHTPSTGSTPIDFPEYDLGLMLLHDDSHKLFPSMPIAASDFSMQNIHGLLGRDVLAHCLLVYDGRAKSYALAF